MGYSRKKPDRFEDMEFPENWNGKWNFQKIEMACGISTGYQEFAGALVLGLQIFGQIFEGVFRGEALFFLEHPGVK